MVTVVVKVVMMEVIVVVMVKVMVVVVVVMFAGEKSTCALEFCVPGINPCAASDFKGDLPARDAFRRPSFVNTRFTNILKPATIVNSISPLKNGLFTSSLG